MPVFQIEAPGVSDLRLPLPMLLGHDDQAPLFQCAGGKSELGTVRRDGVGSVPDAGEERQLPVIQRRPSMHVDRRIVRGLLGTSHGDDCVLDLDVFQSLTDSPCRERGEALNVSAPVTLLIAQRGEVHD
ncbi:hypothetical protein [Streptomyces phaeochromogenes]|uniref:hypothetical protein n=1 Tax=Streptomyces phaeochromogenes TaxID=1923 RepID=UPI0033D9B392